METFSALLTLCEGNTPVTGGFPLQRPVTWSFDAFFHLRLTKRLSKQSWGWWFETSSWSIWRHCNVFLWLGAGRGTHMFQGDFCVLSIGETILKIWMNIESLWNDEATTSRHRIFLPRRLYIFHSVESPSMVDPQWDIWYWGSKWNLHTVCWSAVGCEWGTTSVYFGITYVCFIPSRLPVFAVEPQYLLQHFLFLSKVSFKGHIQNLQKISCWFKFWMGFVGPILIKLWTSSIWGFL